MRKSLPPIEWDEGTRVVRQSIHTAKHRTHFCSSCSRTVEIGDEYVQTIALNYSARVTHGIAGDHVYFVQELQRDITHSGCLDGYEYMFVKMQNRKRVA